MRVEKRTLARTGTMSSLEYLTTRAPSLATAGGEAIIAIKPSSRAASVRTRSCTDKTRFLIFIDSLLEDRLCFSDFSNEAHRKPHLNLEASQDGHSLPPGFARNLENPSSEFIE